MHTRDMPPPTPASRHRSQLDAPHFALALSHHANHTLPRLTRLWNYYRNPMRDLLRSTTSDPNGRWYRLAQECGLPPRIVGKAALAHEDRRFARREVVIENDIGWRLHTMVDFVFGKPFSIHSKAADPAKAAIIDKALAHIFESSGGLSLWQDAGLLAHVFGHVDFLVSLAFAPDGAPEPRIEMIDPRRGIPIVNRHDYRKLDAYLIRTRHGVADEPESDTGDLSIRVITPTGWTLYEADQLVDQDRTLWNDGVLPVVHVQNVSQPLAYEGLGEVEPLVPLQDELNTRLSDRACRVALQSFKMYLAKGLDGVAGAQVGPGQLWITDNTDAAIDEFGGDAGTPGEERHIAEIRDAMDKVSGVPPLASGVVQAKIGNLSSATALRVTLMSLLSRTARKQAAYERAIQSICRFLLGALHFTNALHTTPQERAVSIRWPDPLPVDVREQILAAEAKVRLGLSREVVLGELGYRTTGEVESALPVLAEVTRTSTKGETA